MSDLTIDRSGRTLEEYRQLYWDGKKRIKELETKILSVKPAIEAADRITELEEMNTAAEMLVRQTRKRITELEASTRKSIVTFNEYQEEMEALCTSYTARLKLAESYVPSFDWKMYQQAKAAIKGDGDG